MGKSLREIAIQLKDSNKKVQLIYAFNGSGKTRLSREYKELVDPKGEAVSEETGLASKKILYYNAFTEWVFKEQGQEPNVISNFQNYTNRALAPKFSPDFSEVMFSVQRGNDDSIENIKISKGEESNFVWSVFYSLMEQVVEVLNNPEVSERETDKFNQLQNIFIDDPVTSLDDKHLIKMRMQAVL